MSFKVLKKQPPPRPPELLVLEEGFPPEQQPGAPWNQRAPGLYPGETVVALETGDLVAVSVSKRRRRNGAGMEFRCWARVVDEEGQTRLDPHRQEMELDHAHPAPMDLVEALGTSEEEGDALLTRALVLAMLGEPPLMRRVHVDPDAPVVEVALDASDWAAHPEKAPPGTTLDPGATHVEVLPLSEEVARNISVRHALALAARATPEVDLGSALGR